MELLYVAFMLVQILHPSVLSLEKDSGDSKDSWKNLQSSKHSAESAKRELAKVEKEYLSETQSKIESTTRLHSRHSNNTDPIKPDFTIAAAPAATTKPVVVKPTTEAVKSEAKSEGAKTSDNPDYLTLHSRYMLVSDIHLSLEVEAHLAWVLFCHIRAHCYVCCAIVQQLHDKGMQSGQCLILGGYSTI